VTTVYPLLPELQLLLTTRTGAALRAFLKAASKVAVGRFLIFFATLYLGLGGKKSLSEDVGKVFALHLQATVCGHLVFTYRGKAFDDAGFLLGCFLASLANTSFTEFVKHCLSTEFALRATKEAVAFSLISLAFLFAMRVIPAWQKRAQAWWAARRRTD